MVYILSVVSSEHLKLVRELFEEYSASRPGDPALVDFPEEIANLPGRYAPPEGAMLLAFDGDQLCGCVALRQLDPQTCEMKRLYVRPVCRRSGIGKVLAEAIIAEARQIGYWRMRLDTIPGMDRAQALYRRLGFQEIPAYRYNPNPGTLFFELTLKESFS